MELVTIEVKLPKEVYDRASEILAKQGLSMEDALILFLKETVRLGRIPFDYKVCNSVFFRFMPCGFGAAERSVKQHLQTWREGQHRLISALHPSDPC